MNIDGVTNQTYAGLLVEGAAAEGIRVIRSHGVTLDKPIVRDCKGAGILDYGVDTLTIVEPDLRGNGRGFVPDSSGKDTQGSGIIVQGAVTEILGGYIADNGNETTLEHGVYVSKAARNAWIERTVILRNAASGIKLAGGVTAKRLVVGGSPRGVVLATLPTGITATLTDSDIAGTLYAVMVEIGAVLTGFTLDNNRYAKGSKFRLSNGTVVSLTGWKAATGLDAHSVETP